MRNELLHIYRNTPFGRENLLQSIYFCSVLGIQLVIYLPETKKMLMYFASQPVQVDLDSSYLKDPESRERHILECLDGEKVEYRYYRSSEYSASNLADVNTDFDFMSSPRVISDLSSKIGLGHIGSKVRNLLLYASFPILIPSQSFKKWNSITVMFGGSKTGVKSLQLAIKIAQTSGFPLYIFTHAEKGKSRNYYQDIIKHWNLWEELESTLQNWYFYEKGELSTNLFSVPHDSLVIMGILGHGSVKEFFFGSTTEKVQTTLPNNMLLIGPRYEEHWWYKM